MKLVAENIKKLRQKYGWNQAHVAKQLNISIPAFSKIETGMTDINVTRLRALAFLFNVTTNEILESSEKEIKMVAEEELKKCKFQLVEREKELFDMQKKLILLYDELRSR